MKNLSFFLGLLVLGVSGLILGCGQPGNIQAPSTPAASGGPSQGASCVATSSVSDTFPYVTGQPTNVNAIASGPSGSLVAVGSGTDASGVKHWLVRRSTDGVNWKTIDDFNTTTGMDSSATSVSVLSDGTILVGGWGTKVYGATGINYVGRFSKDNGVTWNFQAAEIAVSQSESLPAAWSASTAPQSYFAVDFLTDPTTHNWHVIDGMTFSTLDVYDSLGHGSTLSTQPTGIVANATGVIFASGAMTDLNSKSHWIVRSGTPTTNFSNVDDFLYNGLSAQANTIGIDSSQNLYTAGWGTDGTSQHWLVRSNTGGSWSTINDFQSSPGSNSSAQALTVDGAGVVLVAGQGITSSGGNGSYLRTLSTGSNTWKTQDTFQLVSGANSAPNGLVAVQNSAYLSVNAQNSGGTSTWVVRKVNYCP